ncbi:hypothetical protein AAFF_G00058960 [Aldrovandia affinis]|uniref:Uncharacterized protein n=1 Tax=Aldrovandia affinis TaxID=143900 RepID=A0AAD7S0G0_9TELE|nr:hypothetical protein AAFF_G00058960 [Aldrovandia affinis]
MWQSERESLVTKTSSVCLNMFFTKRSIDVRFICTPRHRNGVVYFVFISGAHRHCVRYVEEKENKNRPPLTSAVGEK